MTRKHKSINLQIAAIAVPAIAANITIPLPGLVDVAITGHFGSEIFISAIAVGGTMFNMLYWLVNFLRTGTTGFTAQAVGARDEARQILTLYRSLAAALLLGLMLVALSHPVGNFILNFMDADGRTAEVARRYFDIGIWGAPAVTMGYAFSGWFLGMQNARAQMAVAVSINVLNVILSLGLVFGFGMQIEGVALGTVAAQWTGLIIAATITYRKYRPAMPPVKEIVDPKALRSYFRVNTDIFLRTACLVAVTLWFTHAGAVQGATILAANALLLQLFMLFSFFIDGFAFAGEALAGKYSGAGDTSGLNRIIGRLMLIGSVCALACSTLYLMAGETFMRILTDDAGVRTVAAYFLPWTFAVPLCGFAAFVWDGIFVGLVRSRAMVVAMAVAVAVFALTYIATRSMGNDGLWLAFNAYLLARSLTFTVIYIYKK